MQPTPTVPPLRKVMTRTRPTSHLPAAPRPTGGVPVLPQAPAQGASLAPADASPGGVPPRRPGGRGVRTAAPGGRPPGSPGRSARARTRPADNRPVTAGPGGLARANARAAATTAVPAPDRASAAARRIATPAPTTAPATRRVPAQAPRRPVPQLRPTDHFAELLLEVLSGRRPVHAMLRHTVGRAYDELARLAERGPLRTRGTLPVVRDIGYYEARPGALEVFARIGAGDQLRAMAFRLEQGRDLRWRCAAVELGGPRRRPADDDYDA
ncbi:Rv3235 family protein [Streptomyces sp. NPDC032940]|uniref:Rv3235 family protein n=1 Tax=Streptomyces sp. NPDC032940 TaxID=3155366 RepID=UPI0033EBF3EE